MSDLSVIDVQRELRKHADLGHDVTQGPHEVHVHGQPYRMRAHSHLLMPTSTHDNSQMFSLLTLSERPLLTEIDSETEGHRNGPSSMSIHAKWPTIHRWKDDEGLQQEHGFSYKYHPDEEVYYNNHPGYGDWRQHGFTHLSYDSGTPDAHTVLQNHISKPWEYVGTEMTAKNARYPLKETENYHKNMSEFSTRFDLPRALSSMIRPQMEPYHGLIAVTSFGKNGGKHVYDPQTEKLTFLGRH